MHARKILRAIILSGTLLLASAESLAEASAKVDVYKEFQAKLDSLEKELGKERKIERRYDLFLKTYQEILDLRKKNPRQAESKELNMTLFMDSLAPLPAKKDFKAKNCAQYKREVKDLTKSYAKEAVDPVVTRADKLTQLICK